MAGREARQRQVAVQTDLLMKNFITRQQRTALQGVKEKYHPPTTFKIPTVFPSLSKTSAKPALVANQKAPLP
jgi:hypothetical protein